MIILTYVVIHKNGSKLLLATLKKILINSLALVSIIWVFLKRAIIKTWHFCVEKVSNGITVIERMLGFKKDHDEIQENTRIQVS